MIVWILLCATFATAQPNIVGTWLANVFVGTNFAGQAPGFPLRAMAFFTFGSDGTMSVSFAGGWISNALFPEGGADLAGVGSWRAIGVNKYESIVSWPFMNKNLSIPGIPLIQTARLRQSLFYTIDPTGVNSTLEGVTFSYDPFDITFAKAQVLPPLGLSGNISKLLFPSTASIYTFSIVMVIIYLSCLFVL